MSNETGKKRDLSSKSNDGDDSKRQRESGLDDSIANTTNTDVFTESLNSEDCVAILDSCMRQLHEIRDKTSYPDVWNNKR